MSRNQNRRGGRKRGRAAHDGWLADARDAATLCNAAFDEYYRGGVVPEAQWDAFAAALRRPLPMALRVHPSRPCAGEVLSYVRSRLEAELPVWTIPFVPGGVALQCAVSRGGLKRGAALRGLKFTLAALNEGGALTRQEAVSMLPAALLDVRPGHRVLDMCAAPGSKTSQILDALLVPSDTDNSSNNNNNDNNNNISSDSNSNNGGGGVVVANDVNASRLDVLLHQTNRTPGAHAHLIVTNYDAMQFPLGERFDRVLCDVMCSGDGTLRKSTDLWPRWNALQGADLHAAQVRVLLRGMALCRRGGRVVYSTCSLNPVEDEAVVAAALRQCGAAFRLVDAGPLAPGLDAAHGMDQWALRTKDRTATLRTFEDAQAFAAAGAAAGTTAGTEGSSGGGTTRRKGFQYRKTMFADTAQLREMNIHYTRRVLPHVQDTGGFFVAVFECVEEFHLFGRDPAATATATAASVPSADDNDAHAIANKNKNGNENHCRAALQPISPQLQDTVRAALGLPAEFPTARLFSRSESARGQKLYYANEAAADLAVRLGPRVVHVGCKVFESYAKHSNEKLRFSPDGAATLAALLPQERVAGISAGGALELSRAGAAPEHALRPEGAQAKFPADRSFLMRCEMAVVGPVFIAAERIHSGQISAKVFDWQAALAKLTLGQPLAPPGDGKNEAEGDAQGEETEDIEGTEKSQDTESGVLAEKETVKE